MGKGLYWAPVGNEKEKAHTLEGNWLLNVSTIRQGQDLKKRG